MVNHVLSGREFIYTPANPVEFSDGVSVRHEVLFRAVASTCLAACSVTYSVESVVDSASEASVVVFPPHQPDACQADRDAQACVAEYADADIALVNYALSFDDAEQLADEVEQRIETTTRGVIDADVKVVAPNRDAQKTYYEAVDDRGCVDSTDQNNYASYIASRRMDELQQYDKVVGLTKYPECSQEIGGRALTEAYRYADVFDVGETSELTISHEILHLFGLGHSGILQTPKGDFDWNGYWRYRSLEKDVKVDVNNQFVASGVFDEYGAAEVMGAPDELRRGSTINAVQQATLEQPLRQEGLQTKIALHDLAHGTIEYFGGELNNSLTVYAFEEPIEFGGRDVITGKMTQKTFTKVGIAPEQVYPVGDNPTTPVVRASVYLVEQDNSMVTLGKIPFGNIESWDSSRTLVFGEEKIIIAAKNGKLTIRAEID